MPKSFARVLGQGDAESVVQDILRHAARRHCNLALQLGIRVDTAVSMLALCEAHPVRLCRPRYYLGRGLVLPPAASARDLEVACRVFRLEVRATRAASVPQGCSH